MSTITADATSTRVSPLKRSAETFPTALWNDSADPDQLRRSIAFGAVGATCNPVIALAAIKAHTDVWVPRIAELAAEMPDASESAIGWRVVEELSIEAAALLEPIFHAQGGVNGRLSIQTDPRGARSKDALVEQAVHFSQLAPNIIVKIPATAVGIEAIEEATYRGVSINATVSFTLPQAIAVAEAIERGFARREAEGLPVDGFGSVCTIMGGRLSDWLKADAAAKGILLAPGQAEWGAIATLKKAYRTFQERGFRVRLLAAAFRDQLQWSELQGGDLVVSPPFEWQVMIDANDLPVENRIDLEVDPALVADLHARSAEFRKAYDADGMTVAEFDDFGACRKTLRQFLEADASLDAIVRDVLIPA
jgi:transaldolase